LNIKLPNHLENHLPAFEATHSSSDIHGNVNKKGKIDEVSTKKTRQTANSNSSSYIRNGARLNSGNGGEGKGSRVSQDDNTDTHVDPEPQITTASILVR
jgi:hypothetical protein